MTRTQYFTATSVDGFIADADHSLEWLSQASSAERTEDRFTPFFSGVGAMVMGANTYEWVMQHERLLDNPSKWHSYYGDTPCWVFTHRDLPAIPGVDLHFAHDDVMQVHERMDEAAGGKNIWIVGGGDLVGQFADQGLLDEVHLQLAPVTLGQGAPLLPRRLLASDLTLAAVDRDGQFVHLIYQVTTRSAGSN